MTLVEKVKQLKTYAVSALSDLLDEYISTSDKRAGLLSYWIADYVKLLRKEEHVKSYGIFKRGSVVKVHFGYRIGHEEGGLHYAVVVSNYDFKYAGTLTVIPLTSLKSPVRIAKLRSNEVFLGAQLLQKLYEKNQQAPDASLAKEISRLKWGSIALVRQITTVSKLRIMDPLSKNSPLAGIRLGADAMNEIDDCIKNNLLHA